MSILSKIRFWIIGALVGDATYVKNIRLDWNSGEITINDLSHWSNVHTLGDPTILNSSGKEKLSTALDRQLFSHQKLKDKKESKS